MRKRAIFMAGLLLGGLPGAQAQILTVTSGDYSIIAQTQAHTDTDLDSASGNVLGGTYSRSASAFSSFDDPVLGLHTASGNASLNWNTSTTGQVTTISGGVGGVAEAVSNGLDTYALGSASVHIYFDIHAPAIARVDSEGTFNSDLYVLDSGTWQPFYPGMNGIDEIAMPVGTYRWSSGAGSQVSGYDYYSAGIFFSLEARPVPEPATLVALGIGGLALLRRRSGA